MNSIEVSVIIPVYNRTFELNRAIKSVLNQSFRNYEIIVIDDYSTINIEGTIKGFNNSNIKLIKHSSNKGAAAARNTGVDNAVGEFIALLDSDDEWLPNHLEGRIKLLKETNADGSYGAAIEKQDDKIVRTSVVENIESGKLFSDYLLKGGLKACTPSIVVRKNCFQTIKFDPMLRQLEDYDFNMRFFEKYVYVAHQTPTVIVNRNYSTRSLSTGIKHDSFLYFYNKNYKLLSSKKRKNFLLSTIYSIHTSKSKDEILNKYLSLLKKEQLNYSEYKLYLCYKYKVIDLLFKLYRKTKGLILH